MNITVFDLIYVIAAVCFNLLVIGVYIFSKLKKWKIVHNIGYPFISLAIPFAVVLIDYIIIGKKWQVFFFMVIILLIFPLQWWLDFHLKSDFRERWKPHALYISYFYLVQGGLIYNAFNIGEIPGYIVSISFWCLLAALIYSLVGKKKKSEKKE